MPNIPPGAALKPYPVVEPPEQMGPPAHLFGQMGPPSHLSGGYNYSQDIAQEISRPVAGLFNYMVDLMRTPGDWRPQSSPHPISWHPGEMSPHLRNIYSNAMTDMFPPLPPAAFGASAPVPPATSGEDVAKRQAVEQLIRQMFGY